MSETASRPDTTATTWRVDIPMPVFTQGRRFGQPVGWLSLNQLPSNVSEKILWDLARKEWRLASYIALVAAGVPRSLGRIEVTVELRFPDRRVRDTGNFEPTIKPVIDALGPQRIYHSRNVKKDHGLVVEVGRGIIAGDDPRYLVRPNAVIGEPLGRKHPHKGVITLHICPLAT